MRVIILFNMGLYYMYSDTPTLYYKSRRYKKWNTIIRSFNIIKSRILRIVPYIAGYNKISSMLLNVSLIIININHILI